MAKQIAMASHPLIRLCLLLLILHVLVARFGPSRAFSPAVRRRRRRSTSVLETRRQIIFTAQPPTLSSRHDTVRSKSTCRSNKKTQNSALCATRVGIAGAGAVAFGSAARLVQNGHDPMLWSPSGFGTADLLANASVMDASTPKLISTGAIESVFTCRVATSPRQLIDENEVILLALPANGHVDVMDTLAPYIRSDQTIIISSHSSLGALYLGRLLAQRKVQVPIVAWGTTAVTARRTSGVEVQVCTVRTQIDLCTVPESASEHGLELCQSLFGNAFKQRDGILAISLSNLNAQNHLGIVLGNMSRMERGESWSQGLNITPNIGRLLEALDEERLAIADALGVKVRTVREHFSLSFHVPIASVSEMNQQMVQKGNDVNGPATADTRYVTEDVPYGLTLIVKLGDMVGIPALLHESGIRVVSAMYGRDFGKENGLLNALNLTGLTPEDIKEADRTGV
eukprot:CAMPEP_0178496526 /NCGR_PEP_ID=MMETSP0696-20121128/14165_1 /TAXON_ID=265572 /ORGANISM="Extubocellulus spinifer, Strain CCMP396" /LENGTH=455 /DNA_ID=CAMNT_0020124817 /DNA_START=116 /DNA_END=1480 /DNA_ORIENTATION=-